MNERKIEIPFKEYLRVQPVGRRSNKEKKNRERRFKQTKDVEQ